jgi:dTDP-glucose 4,6-dehydratase
MLLITGGAGFIGSNFVHHYLSQNSINSGDIINIDALTYAGNLQNLENLPIPSNEINNNNKHVFIHLDILDLPGIRKVIEQYQPTCIMHFAAESHVDKSINSPEVFVQTNINGTFNMVEAARTYYNGLNEDQKKQFKFIHVSTDEVYGSLKANDPPFTESTVYAPNSPYSASKAASDYIIRSYYHTFNLPCIITHCSNNYGPYQFPEKLIPLIISKAINNQSLPIYGDGSNIRDWLHVQDHCEALMQIMHNGKSGEIYNIGGCNEKTNLEVVQYICEILDKLAPRKNGDKYAKQITYVKDRAGHDHRYAIDNTKISQELNWKPKHTFESGILSTVEWYLHNQEWMDNLTAKNNK